MGYIMADYGLREFARMKGVSLQAVQDAIKSGRIHKNEKGRIDEDQTQAWEDYRDQSKVRDNGKGKGKGPEHNESAYQKAKAQKEVYGAQLKKLEYEERAGRVIEKDSVKVAAFNLARTIRDTVLGIPDRVASEVAAELSRELGIKADLVIIDRIVHRVFDRESRAALQELSKGLDV